MIGTRLRVVDWNLNGFHTVTDDQLSLLKELDADVLTLQEVLPSSRERLSALGYASSVLARDLPARPDGPGDRSARFCTAIFVRAPLRLTYRRTLAKAPSPKRTTLARVEGAGRAFTLASLAAAPGVTWGDAKTVQGDRIARWWARRRLPVLAGMDRNGPKYERLDDVEWWPRDSMALFGDGAAHDLHDVYLDYLDQHSHIRRRIRDAQRAGPLATSYDRGRGRPVPSRYDAMYASPEFVVHHVGYEWQRAIEAGSDHALVHADLTLQPDTDDR